MRRYRLFPVLITRSKILTQQQKFAAKVGFPIMLKASNGGGGRGMRIVNTMEDLEK